MANSIFQKVETALPIEVFQITKHFNDCLDPKKVDLGIGAYRDEYGKPLVLPVVRTAELQIANDPTLDHEYLPISGLPDFRTASIRLMLGGHKVIVENKVEAFQSIGGTGALKIAAVFLKNVLMFNTVYFSRPTWENHKGIFRTAGFTDIREYSYWDSDTKDFNFTGMCGDLLSATRNSVVVLHVVAHNPTGIDPSREQWKRICEICKEKKFVVLMDCAYQGFASGDVDSDAWAARYFADQDIELFITQSYSKNFGLYNERVGSLIVIMLDEKKLPEVRSQMEVLIRTMWLNPPNHGSRIVATVLNNSTLFSQWRYQIMIISERIKKMRNHLKNCLKQLGTPGSWDHIVKQLGIFSYTGLTEPQVAYMKNKYVFLLKSGRMSIAGLTYRNVQYVAKVMDEAVRAHPMTKIRPLEFAKQKLNQVEYNVLKTSVIIDGALVKEDGQVEYDVQSVESFIKVQLIGNMSSSSSSELDLSQHLSESRDSAQTAPGETIHEHETDKKADEEDAEVQEQFSTSNQPGTMRTSVKTYKTRSVQTLKNEDLKDLYEPKSVPARFEGTMLTPVYFDGLIITAEKLDNLLLDAAKKDDNSIPVKFQGGMLTAAFKTLAENLNVGFGAEPVNVKFHGRLKGLSHNEANGGIPVAFDGNMVPHVKTTKAAKG